MVSGRLGLNSALVPLLSWPTHIATMNMHSSKYLSSGPRVAQPVKSPYSQLLSSSPDKPIYSVRVTSHTPSVLDSSCYSACPLQVFFEAISKCVPSLPIRPCVVKYLGKSHNLWHRAALMLENMSQDGGVHNNVLQIKPKFSTSSSEFDFEPNTPNTALQQVPLDIMVISLGSVGAA